MDDSGGLELTDGAAGFAVPASVQEAKYQLTGGKSVAIIIHEIRKLFGPKMVLMLVSLNVVFYLLFMQFYFQYFPNGRPELDMYRLSIEMKHKFGTHMDETEFKQFKLDYEKRVKDAEILMQRDERFVEADIATYEQFLSMERDNELLDKLFSYAFFEKKIDLFWELQERRYVMDRFENRLERPYSSYSNLNEQQKHKIDGLEASGEHFSVMSYVVFENFRKLMIYMAIAIYISILLIISPVYLRDRNNRVNQLQFTLRIGRPLFKKKLIAALLSATIIMTAQLGCFFMLYSQQGVGEFLDLGINSIFNNGYYWYDITFGLYIAVIVAALYVLGLVTALVAVWISSVATSYIAIIALQVPYLLLLIWPGSDILVGRLTDIQYPRYVQPIVYGLLLAGAVLLILLRWRRELRRDMLH